ncbi:MAG: glycosyltransferase family 4 protein [Natronomonas sp.]
MYAGFVVPGDLDSTTGGYLYDRRLRDALRNRGHEIEMISIPRHGYARGLFDNLRPPLRGVGADRFDVLIEDGLGHPSLLLDNRRIETPTVGLLHMIRSEAESGLQGRIVGGIEGKYLRGLDGAIHNSGATRRCARRLGCPARDVVAPPTGDRFDPDVTPDEIRDSGEDDRLDVLFVGGVVPRKGIDVLIEAIDLLDCVTLTVVGDRTIDPGFVAEIEATIQRRTLGESIHFAGRLDDDALESELREADVLAVPSRYEPFGIVYLEAMGFGTVPVATTNGGPAEFIDDGVSGFVVEPTAAQVADRLSTLTDPERRAEMAVAARAAYDSHPDWPETVDRIEAFLEGVA